MNKARAMPVEIVISWIRMEEPAAATGDTACSLAMTLIAAIDHTFPGRYLPRFETNQIREAIPKGRNPPQPATSRRQVSIRRMYVSSTMIVASAIHSQSIERAANLPAAALHCPRNALAAAQTIAAAKIHCAATKSLRRVLVNYFLIDIGVTLRR